MSNPILQHFEGQKQQSNNQMTQEQFNNMVAAFQNFRNQFQGDPNQKIQELMSSGKMTQMQYNGLLRAAQMMARMMGMVRA